MGDSGRAAPLRVRKSSRPPYVLDLSRIRRFRSSMTVFRRVEWDSSWEGYRRWFAAEIPRILEERREGYSLLEYALARASRAPDSLLRPHVAHSRDEPYHPVPPFGRRHEFSDPREASAWVKGAAEFFGADLVGICRLNRLWVYEDADVPEGFDYVVVMAVAMDREAIETSPALGAEAATGLGYSRLVFLLSCVGEFIRSLGYGAIESRNDTALNIPLAIDAGLGELGRNGLLITPQFGSRVRICKVFTDLPMEPDSPIEFGVREFCRRCKLCAESCEVGAISKDDEPTFEGPTKSNNPGALKWYIDPERCYLYWCENGASCSTCIAVCPFSRSSAL